MDGKGRLWGVAAAAAALAGLVWVVYRYGGGIVDRVRAATWGKGGLTDEIGAGIASALGLGDSSGEDSLGAGYARAAAGELVPYTGDNARLAGELSDVVRDYRNSLQGTPPYYVSQPRDILFEGILGSYGADVAGWGAPTALNWETAGQLWARSLSVQDLQKIIPELRSTSPLTEAARARMLR